MDVMTHGALRRLVESGESPCVSVFMPTHRTGRDIRQDPSRLRDLLKEAQRQLEAQGVKSAQITSMLKPARDLIEDDPFWQNNQSGLALFMSKSGFEMFRLPIEVDDICYVNDRYYIKPLVPMLQDKLFYILAVSMNAVRLLECHSHSCRPVRLPEDVSLSLDDAIRGEEEHETHTMRHGGDASNITSGGGSWHGQGEEIQQKAHEDMMFFLRQLDDGVRRALKDVDEPIVLAGVDSVLPFYRRASSLRNLHSEALLGNYEHTSDEDLSTKARALLEPMWHEQLNALQERYGTARGQGIAGSAVEDILPAAQEGRVDTLFVPNGVTVWGCVDEESGQVRVHEEPEPGDEDLIDRATSKTLMTSGRVVAVTPDQIPGNRELAAIYRY